MNQSWTTWRSIIIRQTIYGLILWMLLTGALYASTRGGDLFGALLMWWLFLVMIWSQLGSIELRGSSSPISSEGLVYAAVLVIVVWQAVRAAEVTLVFAGRGLR